jgi:hypothetical protein
MKKDMLNELTGLDEQTVNEIAGKAPELDKAAQERILKKCMEKDGSADAVTVTGTERIERRGYRNFAAAAAAIVLIGGIGGAFAVGRNMKKNAPVESNIGLQISTEESTDVNNKAENSSAAATEGSTVQAATASTKGVTASAENVQATTYGKGETEYPDLNELDPDKAEIIVQNPNENGTELTDDEKYPYLKDLPEEYREKYKEAIDNLKPGEVIHLPCLPMNGETVEVPDLTRRSLEWAVNNNPDLVIEITGKEYSDNNVEVGYIISQDIEPGTLVKDGCTVGVTISLGKEPEPMTTEPTVPIGGDEPVATYNEPNVYLTVLKPITGYWYSNRTPQAQYYFGADGEGSYYDGNTCWGYSFHYTYDINTGTLEYAAYNADHTLSDTVCGKGRVYFTNNSGFLVSWEGSDEMEGFKPNIGDSIEE